MIKGNFKYNLKSNDLAVEYEGECIYYDDKNILMYKEENGTDVLIDLANLILTRENEEMLLVLNFSLGESYINMKKMNGKMPLMLTVNDKKIESNLFSVNYTLSDQNKFKFTLEWTF